MFFFVLVGLGVDLGIIVSPDAAKVNYQLPGFFGKFFELQSVMWTTNAGLTDRHTYDSRPHSWPRLLRGIVSNASSSPSVCALTGRIQNFWVKDHRQIYLIGNPIIWWLSTLSVALYVSVRGFLILRAKRGYRDFDSSKLVFASSLFTSPNVPRSQSGEIRLALWVPVRRVGPSLLSILPHGPTALSASLLSRALFRHSPLLRRV